MGVLDRGGDGFIRAPIRPYSPEGRIGHPNAKQARTGAKGMPGGTSIRVRNMRTGPGDRQITVYPALPQELVRQDRRPAVAATSSQGLQRGQSLTETALVHAA